MADGQTRLRDSIRAEEVRTGVLSSFHLSRDDIACRNQYIIKTSVPTSDEYISPDTKTYEEKGTGFVLQHECAPAWSHAVHEREAD